MWAGASRVTDWRKIAAAAATLDSVPVTQFSPDGFREAIGSSCWFAVRLGPLALCHDGAWVFCSREETCEQRMAYAHHDPESAIAAMRAAFAPDVPVMLESYERMYANWEERA